MKVLLLVNIFYKTGFCQTFLTFSSFLMLHCIWKRSSGLSDISDFFISSVDFVKRSMFLEAITTRHPSNKQFCINHFICISLLVFEWIHLISFMFCFPIFKLLLTKTKQKYKIKQKPKTQPCRKFLDTQVWHLWEIRKENFLFFSTSLLCNYIMFF